MGGPSTVPAETSPSPSQEHPVLTRTSSPSTTTLNATDPSRMPPAMSNLDKYLHSKYKFERRALGLKTERILGPKDWLDGWQRKWDILEKQSRLSKI
ncbi:uncharacterized protein PAC_01486 [Phialocephala subalpina]|uniref:Uncharacterized protein n=1 Tax=Phialocephala subalpina TaxID=576137 RepID=A0A1L7WFT6_9HELO|nr:uncharacterized protein PAC_01486 [Phialocephala subalpina]